MAAEEGFGAPPSPRPRSPPRYPDLCGRHRLQAEVQLLSREISFLEEELQSVEGLQPVSACCKEIDDYVGANPDPLIPIFKKRNKHRCIWRWLRAMVCCNPTRTCCSGDQSCRRKRPSCTCKQNWSCPSCCACTQRNCCKVPCSRLQCAVPTLSCPGYSCGCVCSCSFGRKVCLCPRCLCCIS
ncbi:unnamed protein product [Musa acuminata var. zebrina]